MALRIPVPSTEFDKLAQHYRVRQAAEAATTAVRVGSYWKGVEVGNEDSERNFIELSVAELAAGFERTRDGSIDFFRETLREEPPVYVEPNREQMAASMGYIGPIQARRAIYAGRDFEITPAQARAHVETQVRGSAVRLSAMGGREQVRSSADGKRIGYARVTGYDPCYFCVMLASRRAVFEADSFDESDPRFEGWGTAKVHDGCACALVVVTQMSASQLTQMDYHEKLWNDLSSKNPKTRYESPVLTFRRNYNALRAAA